MRRRIRPDDRRSDELLAASGRRAYELGLGIGWTAGIIGPKAKAASERGAFAWKRAARLPGPEQAAELFVRQCRTRNPLVGAGATGALLLEVDGEPELPERFGLVIPETVRVASRRGAHHYLRPPAGRAPLKVQVTAEGLTTSSDGYLIAAPGLHESGVVYSYLSDPEVGIAEVAVETYERILGLGGETREQVREDLAAGGELVEGMRRDTLFSLALELAHRGLDEDLIGFCVAEVNRRLCRPPLGARDVEHQVHGAVVRARRRPSREQELHQRALQALATVTDTPTAVVARASGRPPAKHHEALELVREMLAGGPRPSAEVKAEGRARGLSERTVERASKELGVLSEVAGDTSSGKGGRVTFWHPPAEFWRDRREFWRDRPEFWRDRPSLVATASQDASKIGRDKTVAPSSNPGLYVGLSGGSVTPFGLAPRVLSRPTSETPSEGADESFGATDPGTSEPPKRRPS